MFDLRLTGAEVMERSLHSVRSVFMEQLRPALSQAEMAVLAGWYDLLCQTEQLDTGVDLVVSACWI